MALVRLGASGSIGILKDKRRNPDLEAQRFCRSGEFSPWADITFEKHIQYAVNSKRRGGNPYFWYR